VVRVSVTAATHPHTRRGLAAALTVAQGFESWAKRAYDASTMGTYRKAIRAAEAAGDRQALAEWVDRKERAAMIRHRRLMDAPKLAFRLLKMAEALGPVPDDPVARRSTTARLSRSPAGHALQRRARVRTRARPGRDPAGAADRDHQTHGALSRAHRLARQPRRRDEDPVGRGPARATRVPGLQPRRPRIAAS
jgi:hypothetical protein